MGSTYDISFVANSDDGRLYNQSQYVLGYFSYHSTNLFDTAFGWSLDLTKDGFLKAPQMLNEGPPSYYGIWTLLVHQPFHLSVNCQMQMYVYIEVEWHV